MTHIFDSREFQSHSTDAPIAFEHVGLYGPSQLFTRDLKLQGQAAYELSFSCGTCYFLFERLGGVFSRSKVKVHIIDRQAIRPIINRKGNT